MAQDKEGGSVGDPAQADLEPLLRSIDLIVQRRQDELFQRLCEAIQPALGENQRRSSFSMQQVCLDEFCLPGETSPGKSRSFEAESPSPSKGSAADFEIGRNPASRSSMRSSMRTTLQSMPRVSRRVAASKKRWQVNAMPLLEEEEYEALADARSKERAIRTEKALHQETEELANVQTHNWAQRLASFVSSKYFEGIFAVVIITNSAFLGISLELGVELKAVDYVYASLFLIELILKISVHGQGFFCACGDRSTLFWNYLDMVIVGTSLVELVFDIMLALESGGGSADMNQTRLIRYLRVIRVLRVMRVIKVVKFISALTSLVSSILSTLKSLLWSLVLLLMVMYVFGILFTDTVLGHINEVGQEPEGEAKLMVHFGSLQLSMHTLFRSVTGGADWGDIADLLIHIDWTWAYFFTGYIAFSYFAVLNVITAVFCQRAIESAEQDEQNILSRFLEDQKRFRGRIEQLFHRFDGLERDGSITLSEMEQFFFDEEVRATFQSLDLTARDAWTLFKLLDIEGNGDINLREFTDGCLRLRGPAKALDIACVMDESRRIKRQVLITEERLGVMEMAVGKLLHKIASTYVPKAPSAPTEEPPILSPHSPQGTAQVRFSNDPPMDDRSPPVGDVPFDVGPHLDLSTPSRALPALPSGYHREKFVAEGRVDRHDVPYDFGPSTKFPVKPRSCNQ